MKFGIKPVYGRLLAYSIIPLLLVIVGTYAGMYLLSPSLTVNLSEEYETDLIDNHNLITLQQAANLNSTFNQLENKIDLVTDNVKSVLEEREFSQRPSYFHDVKRDKLTPRPEFSEKYNRTVDFSVSSYFTTPDIPLQNYTSAMNFTLGITSELDFTFLSIYPTLDDLLWIHVYFNESGIERMYPFEGPRESSYAPLNSIFNLNVLTSDAGSTLYSSPFVDSITNSTVISVAKPVQINNATVATVKFTILLDSIFADIRELTQVGDGAFLLDRDFNVVMHSSFSKPRDVLNQTNQLQFIEDYETNDTLLIELLDESLKDQVVFKLITYGDQEKIVSVIQIKDYIFGLTESIPSINVIGTFSLSEFLIIPLLVFGGFLGLMGLLLRRYGFLRNVGLETLVKLEQSVTSKLEKISQMEVEDLGELVREEIEEKGEELREQTEEVLEQKVEEIKDQVLNIDKTVAAKLNEQLNSLENKLLRAIDEKFENVEDLVQNSKGVIPLSGQQLRNLIQNPQEYLQQQSSIFGVGNISTVEGIQQLPNETTRLAAILINMESIDIETLSALTKKDPEDVSKILKVFPEDYGISINEDQVSFVRENISKNMPHILQIYYQVRPETILSTSNDQLTDTKKDDQLSQEHQKDETEEES